MNSMADDYLEKIRQYAQRTSVEFPHHFGEFLHRQFDEIEQNLEAMKDGFLQRLQDAERRLG